MALNCLNLPPRLCNQPKYTCLAGMIPASNQPDMITISNILLPLANELLELNQGITICTPKYNGGRRVVIKLVNLIGDIVANHKVSGFKSHAGRKFCLWCKIEDHERGNLMVGQLRQRRNVLNAAQKWKETDTVKGRDQLAITSGIHWSELNRLPYWDPVNSVTLGVMHNWYKGVLKHHFHFRWGFDLRDVQRKAEESDESEESDEEMEIDDKTNFNEWGYLSDKIKKKVQNRLQEVIVPKGVGDAANGKLKASEWRALFGVYLPLAVLEFFWDSGPSSQLLLINIGALIECTQILGETSLTPEDLV
ncbi:hypothetical protein O181_087259 [Austropuccinia psidii MF-1]|uniref:Uncharacterized protein n=1 Tax=Austropuccinia psidii MF-1 TaxID=1389203 RepID=A0A9Q3IPD9_9BASI|nr:hypothetical protein [Austropuccinia psidii MF-1]